MRSYRWLSAAVFAVVPLFGALLIQNADPGGGLDDFTNFGLVAQAGYMLNPSWELFGR